MARTGPDPKALQAATFPADQAGVINGIFEAGGPIALNSLPPEAPGFAAQPLALEALGQGFSSAFVLCAVAAFAAALLTLIGLQGVSECHTGENDANADVPERKA